MPRVYTATFQSISFSVTDTTVMELQIPANVSITLLRAWIGAAEGATPLDKVQEIEIYGNDGPATAGSAMVEQEIQGGGGASSTVVAVLDAVIAASANSLYRDAFHLSNGFLYIPVPEERIMMRGGSADPGDNLGIRFPVVLDQTTVLSGGMTWSELS